MSTQFTLIRNLTSGRTDWELKARLSRMWESHLFDKLTNRPGEFTGYELLFIDEEGMQIVASLPKKWSNKYINFLAEGGLYTVTTFAVKAANPRYRVVANDLAIQFLQNTRVQPFPTEDLAFPHHGFSIVPFDQLSDRLDSFSLLTDVVGRMYSCTRVELVGGDEPLKRRLIHLEDSKQSRITVALFGKKAELITDADLDAAPVIVVTSTLIRTWNESMSISSTSATRIFRDVDIPETSVFSVGVGAVDKGVTLVDRPARHLTFTELNEKKRTLQGLAAYCDDALQREAIFYAFARITRILFENDWRYPACDLHNRMVSTIDNIFHCATCKGEPRKTSLRYRIEAEVQDPHGVVTFTLFDKEAEKLLNISAEQLALEELDGGSLPKQIEGLVGIQLLFCVKVSKFNFSTSRRSFTVLKTYTEDELPPNPAAAPSSLAAPSPQSDVGPPTPLQKQQRKHRQDSTLQPKLERSPSTQACKKQKKTVETGRPGKERGKGLMTAVSSSDSDSDDDSVR